MSAVRMQTRQDLMRRDRPEDEFLGSFKEMIAVLQRVHDLGGDPHIKAIIERAHATLGRVPH